MVFVLSVRAALAESCFFCYHFSVYKGFFTKEHVRSLLVAFVLLGLAIVFQFYASLYSTRVSSNFVHDIFLDNLPTIDLNVIIVEGALLAIAGTAFLLATKPQYLIFSLKAVAIFIATRAVFVSVTHLGIYPGQIGPDPTGFFDNIYTGLGLQAGYFFSGHVGLPVLMSLIFWKERFWRFLYIGAAVVFGASVLIAHVHYSIDVLAAPYMTYCIFKISQYFFSADYKLITAS